MLERQKAEEYASWFRALADPTRVQILHLLSHTARPMAVREIVEAMGLAQSTVSQHLKVLSDVRFVHIEPVANARLYAINRTCVECFPTAVHAIMGRAAAHSVPA